MELILYDAACRALAEATRVDEVKDVRDKALAVQLYGRMAGDKQLEINGAEIRIRAERRMGQLLAEMAERGERATTGGDRQSIVATADNAPTLAELGIPRDLSSRAQAIATIPDAEFEAELAQHREEGAAVTGRTMERLAKRAHVANNSGNNEWYTPPSIIEAARAVLGGIDLDPASSAVANRTVRAECYFTADDDGLAQDWTGRVWLNPPYAQPLIAEFSEKLAASVESGAVEAACVLVNNATETAWFQRMLGACSAACFLRGRVRFLDPAGNPGAPLQGQALLYFGPHADSFAQQFQQFGVSLCR